MAAGMAVGVGSVGSAVSGDPFLAGDPGDFCGSSVAGLQRTVVDSRHSGWTGGRWDHLEHQSADAGTIGAGGCHGDPMYGVVSGNCEMYGSIAVGIDGSGPGFPVFAGMEKDVTPSGDSVYSVSDDGISGGFDYDIGRWKMKRKYVYGRFTIEAALLVPLILAVLFLLLQTVLFLHDNVVVQTWLYQETWKLRWNEEQETTVFDREEVPVTAVLRCQEETTTHRRNQIRREVECQVRLLPNFVKVLLTGSLQPLTRQAEEKETDPWRFIRIAGAILEEWEEWKP